MIDPLLRGSALFLASCIACQPAAAQPQQVHAHVRIAEANHGAAKRGPPGVPPSGVHEDSRSAGSSAEPPALALSRKPFGPPDAELALGPVDPGARWVFYCQQPSPASKGQPLASTSPLALRQKADSMAAFLVRPPSSPLRVSALLGASHDGRYLVLLSEDQEPLLYDAEADSTTSLADQELDLRADALRGSIRSIAFAPDGSRVALLTRGKTPRVTIRELSSGSQTSVTPVGHDVWRVSFDGTGKFVVLHEVLEDTNRNGRLDWPIPQRVLRNTQCTAATGAVDAWVPAGDSAFTTLAPIEGGKATRIDGFVAMLGSTPIVKTPGEPLATINHGRAKRLGATDCDAHVIAVSAEFGQILTTCTEKSGHTLLELSSLRGSRTYEYEGSSSFVDRTEPEVNRFVALYAGVRTYLVDFKLAQVTMMQDRDQLLAQGKAGILVRRASQVVLLHVDAGDPETLLDDVRTGTRIQFGPGHVLVGDDLLSAWQGKKLGHVEHPVLSVSSNGCVLVSLGGSVNGDLFPKGPLQWQCPG